MELELEIQKIVYGGEGLAFAGGKACFVEGALAGETVLARVVQDKKNFMRARIVRILKASPLRQAPPCLHAGDCGGCQYQHMPYEEELRWKETQVREYFEKQLKIGPSLVRPIVRSPKEYGYRGSLTLHRRKDGRGYGFFGRDNETVIPVSRCLLAAPPLDNTAALSASLSGGPEDVTFRISAEEKPVTSLEDRFAEIKTGGRRIWTHSRGFFQNNPEVTALAAGKIQSWLSEKTPAFFADLYCGAGTFSLLCAETIKPLVCAEESPASLGALEKNLKESGLEAEILKGRVEKTFPAWAKKSEYTGGFVLLDPPRTGMAAPLPDFLSHYKGAEKIAYLSCHLGSMARDLKTILSGGRFTLREAVPFDMFPRTKHIEILALLSA